MTNRQVLESIPDEELAQQRIKLKSEEFGDDYFPNDYYYGDFEGKVMIQDYRGDYFTAWKEAVRKEVQWLQEEANK